MPETPTTAAFKSLLPVVLVGLAGIAGFYLFPYNLGFLTRILIMVIMVLSLDLVLGYGGIATLGHAALFGTGAYAAGLFAVHVSAAPLPGLVVGAVAGAAIALVSGLALMRAQGLTLLMLSIAVAQVMQEVANKASPITGGSDGLMGISMSPILGFFGFDFIGKTGYWYALIVMLAVLLFLKMVVASPFGLSARGIQESAPRMRAIGTPVYWRLVAVYTLGGAIAGVAGALSAQITELVSLQSYSFSLSAEVLIMLVLGGVGRLYGAIIGTVIFMAVHQIAATIDPFNWLFIIGGLVLVVVYFEPEGFLGFPARLRRIFRPTR